MELIDKAREKPAAARPELDALIGAGLALALQLQQKLTQWGELMEKQAKLKA